MGEVRNIVQQNSCSLRLVEEETTIHTLRDSHTAHLCWISLNHILNSKINDHPYHSFFNKSLQNWLIENGKSRDLVLYSMP